MAAEGTEFCSSSSPPAPTRQEHNRQMLGSAYCEPTSSCGEDEPLVAVECAPTQAGSWRRTPPSARPAPPPRPRSPPADVGAEVVAAARAILEEQSPRSQQGYACAFLVGMGVKAYVVSSGTGNLVGVCASCMCSLTSLCLADSLLHQHLARRPGGHAFPYGLSRALVISGFVLTLLLGALLVVAMLEALELLFASHGAQAQGFVSVALGAALVGAHASPLVLEARSGKSPLLRVLRRGGVDLAPGAIPCAAHVMRRGLLGSLAALGVNVACALSTWGRLDGLGALAVGALALDTLAPVLRACASVLLQTTPAHLRDHLDKGVREVSMLEGVLEVREHHFWALTAEECVGSLRVRLRHDASEETAVQGVRALFPSVARLTVQVEKDDWVM
mmetsp:Transcript_1169/g.3653  ORF Transcript_1169/g.3653 Transcript_1169/m.3653 type:complete len:390 (+) Transcript_1169:3-1172(+)